MLINLKYTDKLISNIDVNKYYNPELIFLDVIIQLFMDY